MEEKADSLLRPKHPPELSFMTVSDRMNLIVLFLSVLAGFALGSWASAVFSSSIAGIAATFAGVVVAYYAIAFVMRRAGYPIE